MDLTDTHCHLNLPTFKSDLEQVLLRAQENNIDKIMVPGTDEKTSLEAIAISDRYHFIFAATGVHPNDANTWNSNSREVLAKLARHSKVKAIGEIGLDYFRNKSEKRLQQDIFKTQLDLAEEVNLPVIIHCREAIEDTLKILFDWQDELQKNNHPLSRLPGVFHAFSGDISIANQLAERGFFVGICGTVTFQNAITIKKVATDLNLENILIETDAPFLTPLPHRGERNEPAYVSYIINHVAKLKNIKASEVAVRTKDNSNQLFGWSESC